MIKLELLFRQELDELVLKGACPKKQKRDYENWVQNAELARNSESLDSKLNQYDKAEGMLT